MMAATHAPIGGMPAIDPRWDVRFRELTSLGNAAFDAGEDANAQGYYREALYEAERLFDAAAREAGPLLVAPMALTIAANNLAAAMDRAGTMEAARAVSVEAIDRLIATAEAADRPIALRLNCLRHLPHALAFAAERACGPGSTEKATARRIERAASVAAEVMRIARHWQQAGTASGGPSTAQALS